MDNKKAQFHILVKFGEQPQGNDIYITTCESIDELIDALRNVLKRPWLENIVYAKILVDYEE